MKNLLHLSFVLVLAGALLTTFTAERGYVTLMKYTGEEAYVEDIVLPFKVELVDCGIEYEADGKGGRAVKDYYTEVRIREYGAQTSRSASLKSGPGGPHAIGGDLTPTYRISMNKILRYQGYRFYQSQMLPDASASLLSVSRDPWGIGFTYAGYALFLIAGLLYGARTSRFASLSRRRANLPVRVLKKCGPGGPHAIRRALPTLLIIISVILSLLIVYLKWGRPGKVLVPVLRSPLLWVHVGVISVSYLLFLIIAILSLVGLIYGARTSRSASLKCGLQGPHALENADLEVRTPRGVFMLRSIRKLLFPAVYLLGAGIIIGSVWANISWGRYWNWDPKETWALITLLVYALPLHSASIKWFARPKVLQWYLLLAILCVAFTYFGVNYFLGGLHSYA